jgi:DNA polymerase-3 subunit beta
MKTTLQRKDLAATLTLLKPATTNKLQSVLGHVLLTIADGAVTLAATNLDVGLTLPVAVAPDTALEDGAVLIPHAGLFKLASKMTAAAVTIQCDDSQAERPTITVSEPGLDATLTSLPTDEFPLIPATTTGDGRRATFDAAELREAILQVAPCAAEDDARPIFTALRLCVPADGPGSLVASDGFRMAERRLQSAHLPHGTESLLTLLPAVNCTLLAACLKGAASGQSVEIAVSPSMGKATLSAGRVQLVTHLIEGTYPNIKQVIPTTFAGSVTLDAPQLRATLKKVQPFCDDTNRMVTLSNGNGHLSVNTAVSETPVTATTPVISSEGFPERSLNGAYLDDCLAAIGTGAVTIQAGATVYGSLPGPFVIGPAADNGLSFVVMPCNPPR